jgi:plasmid stabilization system protein ParE
MELGYVVDPPAQRQFATIAEWCRDNGVNISRLETAVERTLTLLAQNPGIRTAAQGAPDVFRLRRKRTKYQMFFRVNELRREVHTVAFWHTSRGEGPPLYRQALIKALSSIT